MSVVVEMPVSFVAEHCWTCGIAFAVDWRFGKNRKADGKDFFCPNGCRIRYGEGTLQKLTREVEREKKLREWAEQRTENERRSHAATKGQLTRTKKRVANGVCPCCNRTFRQLSRHMANKHPEFSQ